MATGDEAVRGAMFSGLFYPVDPATLYAMIQQCVRGHSSPMIDKPRILIVPHAGYLFSGKIAGAGYAQVHDCSNIILLGVAHRRRFDSVAAYRGAYWQTPLGQVAVSRRIISDLISFYSTFCIDNDAHKYEHALEIQVPFLQVALEDFWIVPLLLGNHQAIGEVSTALARLFDDETLLVASSDLSHYLGQAEAEYIDRRTIEAILSTDPRHFQQVITKQMRQHIPGLLTCACGATAIEVALRVARLLHLDRSCLLAYQNSGHITGDTRRVVGYACIAFT